MRARYILKIIRRWSIQLPDVDNDKARGRVLSVEVAAVSFCRPHPFGKLVSHQMRLYCVSSIWH